MDNTTERPKLTKAQRLVKAALSHGKYRQFLAGIDGDKYVGTANKCFACPFHHYLATALGMPRSTHNVSIGNGIITVTLNGELVTVNLQQKKYDWLRDVILMHDKHPWRITADEAIEDLDKILPKAKEPNLWNTDGAMTQALTENQSALIASTVPVS